MLHRFLATVQLAGCETRAVLARDRARAAELTLRGDASLLERDVTEGVLLVENVGEAPPGSVEGPWRPENGPAPPKVWLFTTEHNWESGTEAYTSRERLEKGAWAWIRENWQELGLEEPIPEDIEAALDVLRGHDLSVSIEEALLDPVPEPNQTRLPTRLHHAHPIAASPPGPDAQEAAWTLAFERLDATELGMELGHMVDAVDQLHRGVGSMSEAEWRRFQVLVLIVDRRLRGEIAPQ